MRAIELQTNLSSLITQLGRVVARTHRRTTYRRMTQQFVIQLGALHRIAAGHHHLQVVAVSALYQQTVVLELR